jgi:hypothetical protein
MIRSTAAGTLASALLLVIGVGCASTDYSKMAAYYDANPRVVVILPAKNLTNDVEAPYLFQSTISKPLIDRGYYVLPPYMVADVLTREGIGLEGESWQIEPQMLARYFGADAVLYVTIEEWDTHYYVLTSDVAVALRYRLVDAHSGNVLWETTSREEVNSGSSNTPLLIGLVTAPIDAAVTATTDHVPLAIRANRAALKDLPPGAYHADYPGLQERIARWRAEKNEAATTQTAARAPQ